MIISYFIIPPLRHFTVFGQKNAQNRPCYYTVEQGKKYGLKRSGKMDAQNKLNFALCTPSDLDLRALGSTRNHITEQFIQNCKNIWSKPKTTCETVMTMKFSH